jgi:hypothetical protein
VFDGDNPLEFVLTANLRRRHLNEGQRAMVGSKVATLQHGQKKADVPSGISVPEAATMLNVSERSIQRARVVQEQGSPMKSGARTDLPPLGGRSETSVPDAATGPRRHDRAPDPARALERRAA